jgi:hypothetical protein
MTPSDKDVHSAASRFRFALDKIDDKLWSRIGISAFPRGACGHCSELLGRYLNELYGIEPEYVVCDLYTDEGEWRGGHAWLEWSGLIIDISGDQFGWPSVVVSRCSDLHASGKLHTRRRFCADDDWWQMHCFPLWSAALSSLEVVTLRRRPL